MNRQQQSRDQVRVLVWYAVSDQVSDQVYDQVRGQVNGQHNLHVSDQVCYRVDQICTQAWEKISDQTEKHLRELTRRT